MILSWQQEQEFLSLERQQRGYRRRLWRGHSSEVKLVLRIYEIPISKFQTERTLQGTENHGVLYKVSRGVCTYGCLCLLICKIHTQSHTLPSQIYIPIRGARLKGPLSDAFKMKAQSHTPLETVQFTSENMDRTKLYTKTVKLDNHCCNFLYSFQK